MPEIYFLALLIIFKSPFGLEYRQNALKSLDYQGGILHPPAPFLHEEKGAIELIIKAFLSPIPLGEGGVRDKNYVFKTASEYFKPDFFYKFADRGGS